MTRDARQSTLDRWLGRLNGPQTTGRGAAFWLGSLVVILGFAFLPQFLSRYQVITFSNYMISALLALSLCLIWGYCGILSLGQAAFFGIGGYAYGIVALNLLRYQGNTDIAFLAGVIAPMVFAAVIGVIMFFARLQGVYVAILTLVISLLLGTFMRQTADPSYTIGAAYLGGMNGLRPASPNDPLLPSLIFGLRDWVWELDGRSVAFYYFTLCVLVLTYLAFRWLVNSSYGYLLIGCREDIERTETFGYDVRLIQISVFCISAGIAGLAGTLYAAWGTYIHPDGFAVAPNILVVIWVAVGGRKDPAAAILGAIGLSWLSVRLTSLGELSLFVQGAILVLVMLIAPDGLITTLARLIGRALAVRDQSIKP
jgi:ABC-type branched-subunit amino acid transport system permease subunit